MSEEWVEETVNAGEGYKTSLLARRLRRVGSDQDLKVFDNPSFGRVMMLDGAVQIATADEFIYHEMMAHVPMFAHGAARRVLIVGGGDGGIAREVLRHRCVETVRLVEIDRAVVDLAVTEFPEVAGGAFDDPRLELVIADGAEHVASGTTFYDVIIVDAPDPVGAGRALFTAAFYRECSQRLADGGIMVTQSGMPFLTPDWLRKHAATLRGAFPDVAFYLTSVPSYAGGPMAHGFLSAGPDALRVPVEILTERHHASGLALRCWTPAHHAAAFALPGYVAALVTPRAAAS